jgi:O-antigen/teichoic acid export membrane protein
MTGHLKSGTEVRSSVENHTMSRSTQRILSGLSLRANFSWTFVGNVVYAGCQWGMLVAIAKLSSPSLVGQFALGISITAPVYMFASLELRNVQAADARCEYSFGDYLSLRIITTILALLVIVGIVRAANYHLEIGLTILAVGVCKAIESISDVIFGLFQQKERMDRVAKSMILKGPISLFALSLGVYLTGSVFWGTVGLAVVWALVLFSYDIRSGMLILKCMPELSIATGNPDKQGGPMHPSWEMRKLARLAWLALPLGLASMLISLQANIPWYFVERHLGTSMLGIFAALAYFDRSGKLVMHALGRSATSRLSQYYVTGNGSAFGLLLLKLVSIGALLGGVGVLVAFFAGEIILKFFYQSEYAMQHVFMTLMVGAGLSYVATFLHYGMIASRYFRAQMLLHVIVTAALVLICVLLIPSGGLSGAAMAVAIARGLEAGGAMAITVYSVSALRRQTKQRGELQYFSIY